MFLWSYKIGRRYFFLAPNLTIGHVDAVLSYYKPSCSGGFHVGTSEDWVITEVGFWMS